MTKKSKEKPAATQAVEVRSIDAVKPYEKNPRQNDAAVAAVATSIAEYGFRNPILVDGDGVIICGHTRLKAAHALGLTEVPVIVAGDLPAAKVKALRIADNKTAEGAEWDDGLLRVEIEELRADGADINALGFSDDELSAILDGGGTDGQTEEDAIPEAPEAAASIPGALYSLGRHTLLCGDSTDASSASRVLRGSKAGLLLTDPPYGVSYVGKTKDALSIDNDGMTGEDLRDFMAAAFSPAAAALEDGASYYVWHADIQGLATRQAVEDAELRVRQCLIWCKNTMVMGRQDYQWKHEPCLYGWKDGASHTWPSDRKQTTVLEFDRPSRSTEHPTMKPVALFEYLICNSLPSGGIVLDVFGGSGTTVVAAEKCGRTACIIELDPRYCDVIRKRWAEFVHGEGCDWQALTPVVAVDG